MNWGFEHAREHHSSTVLITGSSGFLRKGLKDRYRVIGFDLANPKRPLAGVEAIESARERSCGRIASVVRLSAT